MSRIVWDEIGERFYETGVNKGVLYSYNKANKTFGNGVAWNGLTAVNESPSGAEASAVWADNIKYLNLISAEEYGATIEALSYPPEFAICNGEASLASGITVGQQDRALFGFSYQTLIGSDDDGTAHGYKIHLVYNCRAAATEKSHATVNDSPEAPSMSWTISTTPVDVPNHKPTATLEIDSTKVDSELLKDLEDILYGGENTTPRLPLPDEVIRIINGQ